MTSGILHRARRLPRIEHAALGLLVFVFALYLYSLPGLNGGLRETPSMYMYSGQQMANGVPPYQSIFTHKGPLAPIIIGFAVQGSRILNVDDIKAARVAFLAISALVPLAIYVLVRDVFASTWAGLIAALVFIGFRSFGVAISAGPEPKTPMVLFEVLALLFTVRRQWFLAGLCGSLSFLTWQPSAIYAAITFLLSLLQAQDGSERMRNVRQVVIGILAPLIATFAYFLISGALPELFMSFFLFNVMFLERRGSASWNEPLRKLYGHIFGSDHHFVLIGLIAVALVSIYRIYAARGVVKFVRYDRFAAVALTFPLPFLWSVKDFQGDPDFFIFLPYAAIGLGGLCDALLHTVQWEGFTTLWVKRVALLAVCAWLFFDSVSLYGSSRLRALANQRRWAQEVETRFGNDAKVASIGLPQALVLLHKTNPTPYIVIVDGIDGLIDATNAGGVDGWLQELEAYDPSLIFWGRTNGAFLPTLENWLESRYVKGHIGDWVIYSRDSQAIEGAIMTQTEALKDSPADAEAYMRRGLAYKLRDRPGDRDKAISDFRRVLEIDASAELRQEATEHLQDLGA